MSRKSTSSSRRAFLAGTGKLAAASAAAAAIASPAAGQPAGRSGRQPVPGSPSKAYSRAMRLDRLVFVAGCVGRYEKGGEARMDRDFESQAIQTLTNLKASIEAAGSSMDRVLKCTCFLKEQAHFKTFNDVYMRFFPEPRPARSTVVVKDFVVPDALLEVDCVCYAG
jgi:2-iminobutanoate/2-iminopropanoate deaminase